MPNRLEKCNWPEKASPWYEFKI